MAVYLVTGQLGSGKSLIAMGRMRDYLWANKRVATNVNVHVEHLVSGKQRTNILRVPDMPPAEFLWDVLGEGSDSKKENTFGMFLMDEVGAWLDNRAYGEKGRAAIIEWFVHSRKRRWDCYLIAQSVNMIDKKIRESIGEHIVVCSRWDRRGVPIFGVLARLLGFRITLPQVHNAKVFYTGGQNIAKAEKVESWTYTGRDLWGSYDTSQRFQRENDGCSTILSNYDYEYLRKPRGFALAFLDMCKQRDWHRLERIAELLHTQTPAERGYRLLQLLGQFGNDLNKPLAPTFDEWAEKCIKYRSQSQSAIHAAWFGKYGFVESGPALTA